MNTIRRRKEIQGDIDDLGHEYDAGVLTHAEWKAGILEAERELAELDEEDRAAEEVD